MLVMSAVEVLCSSVWKIFPTVVVGELEVIDVGIVVCSDVGSSVGVSSLEPWSEKFVSSAPPPGAFRPGFLGFDVGKFEVKGVCQCTDFLGFDVGVDDCNLGPVDVSWSSSSTS